MKTIKLSQGKEAIVDDADYESLSKYRWHATQSNHDWYARRSCGKHSKKIYMHRQILDLKDDQEGHHGKGGTLDNSRGNLEACSRKENLAYRKFRKD